MARKKKPPIERFEPKYIPEPNSGCYLWLGALAGNGYGSFYDGERMVSAHSFAYRCEGLTVPDGLELDHLCRTRSCVNPNHLEPVTRKVNTQRGVAGHHMRGKTECPRGHPFDDANTHWRPDGRRGCRECKRLTTRWRKEVAKEHARA